MPSGRRSGLGREPGEEPVPGSRRGAGPPGLGCAPASSRWTSEAMAARRARKAGSSGEASSPRSRRSPLVPGVPARPLAACAGPREPGSGLGVSARSETDVPSAGTPLPGPPPPGAHRSSKGRRTVLGTTPSGGSGRGPSCAPRNAASPQAGTACPRATPGSTERAPRSRLPDSPAADPGSSSVRACGSASASSPRRQGGGAAQARSSPHSPGSPFSPGTAGRAPAGCSRSTGASAPSRSAGRSHTGAAPAACTTPAAGPAPDGTTRAASLRAQSWNVAQVAKAGVRQYCCWCAMARGAGSGSA